MPKCARYIDKFSLFDKLWIRSALAVTILTGVYAIAAQNLVWTAVYLGISGLCGGVVLYCLCGHCPHPFRFQDCIYFPYRWILRLVPFRKGRMDLRDRLALSLTMLVILLFPQVWLVKTPLLLALFWISYALMSIRIYTVICTGCRNVSCPMNRTGSFRKPSLPV